LPGGRITEPPAVFAVSMALFRSGTSRISDAIAPAGASFGRVAMTIATSFDFLARSGVDPVLRMISLKVEPGVSPTRRVSDMPKAFL